ncbi:MAG: carboxylesterase family protein, partial [Cardiobacteriaceae bacterium]|nr:carboxylesterase family protein [Cardiobacteriaceae bacterium]
MQPIKSKFFPLFLLSASISIATTSYAAEVGVQAGNNIAVVPTQSGKVQGYVQNGVVIYKGIPYATAERFMPPQKVKNWQDTRLALTYGDVCPQVSMGGPSFFFTGPKMTESEQCLNLNIWSPSISDGKKRAVMVWIHGGGFQSGASNDSDSYDGANLARTGDVVVISINHRLNAMGYLDLSAYGEQYKHSANLGVEDMVSSLEWVKDNIAQFGGDPNNITIFGESGGGAKVLTLMATPAAKGLFQKAIVQSGAVEKMGITLTDPKISQRIAELTLQNLSVKPTELDHLKDLTPNQINDAATRALKQIGEEFKIPAIRGSGYNLFWTPTMDGDYIPQQPVGEKYPYIAKDIPLLIGSNLTEWESFSIQLDLQNAQKSNRFTWSKAETMERLKAKYGN